MTPVKHSDVLSSGAGRLTGALCERARSWAALASDGELSELERKLLRAHVMRCADCSRFEVEVAAVTRELRALALEPLSRTIAIPAPHGRAAYRRLRTAGAAAVVVAIALGIPVRAELPNSDRSRARVPSAVDLPGDRAELRLLRNQQRDAIVAAEGRGDRVSPHFGGQAS